VLKATEGPGNEPPAIHINQVPCVSLRLKGVLKRSPQRLSTRLPSGRQVLGIDRDWWKWQLPLLEYCVRLGHEHVSGQ